MLVKILTFIIVVRCPFWSKSYSIEDIMALPQLSIWQPGDGLRKIKYKYHVCLIVIFSVLIRLLFLTDRYLWCDEASSVLISRHSVDNLLFHTAFDVHPPLYYLLLHDWIILLGDSIAAVRSLSLLFGILTVVLVIALTRWLAMNVQPYWRDGSPP